MRSYAVSPLASFVIHSRWPCTVTPRGTTSVKSASQVVFVDGTITPMRLRTVIGFAVGAPAQSSGARRSATAPARSFPALLCHNLRHPENDGHRDSRRIHAD